MCVRCKKPIYQSRGAPHWFRRFQGLNPLKISTRIMNVYVRNKNGNPLMPCKPAKARKLLRDKKAKVYSRCPFTIQLLWDCEENVQEVTVGIDKGSSVTGFSCVANGEILMSGAIYHRTDIKEKMDARRANRRNRRSRKWYRPKRFLNRASSKRSGRLPKVT